MRTKNWLIALMLVAGVGFLNALTPLKAHAQPVGRIEGHVYTIGGPLVDSGYVAMYYAPVSGGLSKREAEVDGSGYYYIENPAYGKWTGGWHISSASLQGAFDNNSPFNHSGGVLVHDVHMGSVATHGKICGFVTDDGTPPPFGQRVYLSGTVSDTTVTDADGFYQFHNLPAGFYTIMVRIRAQACTITYYSTHKRDFAF